MNLFQYSLLLITGTAIACASFLFVLFGVDPVSMGNVGAVLFFLSGFATCTGALTSFGTLLRAKRFPSHAVEHLVVTSFRQAFLFSSLIMLSLFLLSRDAFTLGTMLILIVFLGCIEGIYLFFFQEKSESTEL